MNPANNKLGALRSLAWEQWELYRPVFGILLVVGCGVGLLRLRSFGSAPAENPMTSIIIVIFIICIFVPTMLVLSRHSSMELWWFSYPERWRRLPLSTPTLSVILGLIRVLLVVGCVLPFTFISYWNSNLLSFHAMVTFSLTLAALFLILQGLAWRAGWLTFVLGLAGVIWLVLNTQSSAHDAFLQEGMAFPVVSLEQWVLWMLWGLSESPGGVILLLLAGFVSLYWALSATRKNRPIFWWMIAGYFRILSAIRALLVPGCSSPESTVSRRRSIHLLSCQRSPFSSTFRAQLWYEFRQLRALSLIILAFPGMAWMSLVLLQYESGFVLIGGSAIVMLLTGRWISSSWRGTAEFGKNTFLASKPLKSNTVAWARWLAVFMHIALAMVGSVVITLSVLPFFSRPADLVMVRPLVWYIHMQCCSLWLLNGVGFPLLFLGMSPGGFLSLLINLNPMFLQSISYLLSVGVIFLFSMRFRQARRFHSMSWRAIAFSLGLFLLMYGVGVATSETGWELTTAKSLLLLPATSLLFAHLTVRLRERG